MNAERIEATSEPTDSREPRSASDAAPPKVSRGSLLTLVVIVLRRHGRSSPIVGIVQRVMPRGTASRSTPTTRPRRPCRWRSRCFEKNATGDRAAGQHAGFHAGAHLRAHHRLREGLVPRHRLACAARAICLPSSRRRSSISSLPRRRRTWPPRRATPRLAKVTADRYQGLIGQNAVSQQDTDNAATQLKADRHAGELRAGECAPAGRAAVLRAHRSALRRRDHRAQSRHRPTDHHRRKHDHPRRGNDHQAARRSSTSPRSRRCGCSSMFRRSMRRMRRTASPPR